MLFSSLFKASSVFSNLSMITCGREVVTLCEDMRQLDREHFRALYLDSRNGLLGVETVAIGSLNATMVHPREVFKAAILLNAAAPDHAEPRRGNRHFQNPVGARGITRHRRGRGSSRTKNPSRILLVG